MLKHNHHYHLVTLVLSFLLVLLALTISSAVAESKMPKTSYPELGLMISFDSIEPSVGYWWGDKGLRLTGIYLAEDHYSLHVNLAYAFKDTGRWQHSINLLTSWIAGSDPGADYKYAATGLAYSFNYRGYFLEMGLCAPWQDQIGNLASDPVVPCGYWGYLHRFN